MKIYLKVEDNIIKDVKFKIFGCGLVIVLLLMVIELIKGKILDEVWELINKVVVEVLDGFLLVKMYCLVFVEEVIYKVINDYRVNNGLEVKLMEEYGDDLYDMVYGE